MINGDDEKYYYFAVESRLELYSLEWLRNKKEAKINGDKDIEFPSHQKDWTKFEENKTNAINILFVSYNTKTISIACKSKYNHKHKNQVILLMITDGKKWHYLAVRSLSALFRGITSSNNGDFYCLNCFYSYCTHNKLKKHERVFNNHDYCHLEMPKENEKNIKIQSRRKIIKSSIYNLCRFRMFAKKRAILSKES